MSLITLTQITGRRINELYYAHTDNRRRINELYYADTDNREMY